MPFGCSAYASNVYGGHLGVRDSAIATNPIDWKLRGSNNVRSGKSRGVYNPQIQRGDYKPRIQRAVGSQHR